MPGPAAIRAQVVAALPPTGSLPFHVVEAAVREHFRRDGDTVGRVNYRQCIHALDGDVVHVFAYGERAQHPRVRRATQTAAECAAQDTAAFHSTVARETVALAALDARLASEPHLSIGDAARTMELPVGDASHILRLYPFRYVVYPGPHGDWDVMRSPAAGCARDRRRSTYTCPEDNA